MSTRRIVVKLGTSTLTDGSTNLSRARMVDLARQMVRLKEMGHEIVLVSSGAIAAGRELLSDPALSRSIPAKQMLSAVGQPQLMDTWGQMFSIYGVFVAQVLLTRADLSERRRYLNARNTLWALLQQGVVPIINENDAVATEEIRVGDNDNLSALVANLIHADELILLTDQDGLFDKDPRRFTDALLIPQIEDEELPEAVREAAGGSGRMGVGGMRTKLQAADLARRAGASVRIARGSRPDVLLEIAAGDPIGTYFSPIASPPESFKRFVLSCAVEGVLRIDFGAAAALGRNGSLLPSGLIGVEGAFDRGASVSIHGPKDGEMARGLSNYSADDCERLVGAHSREIDTRLGYHYSDEIVHRSNLILLKPQRSTAKTTP